jgi:hypothetical protein
METMTRVGLSIVCLGAAFALVGAATDLNLNTAASAGALLGVIGFALTAISLFFGGRE